MSTTRSFDVPDGPQGNHLAGDVESVHHIDDLAQVLVGKARLLRHAGLREGGANDRPFSGLVKAASVLLARSLLEARHQEPRPKGISTSDPDVIRRLRTPIGRCVTDIYEVETCCRPTRRAHVRKYSVVKGITSERHGDEADHYVPPEHCPSVACLQRNLFRLEASGAVGYTTRLCLGNWLLPGGGRPPLDCRRSARFRSPRGFCLLGAHEFQFRLLQFSSNPLQILSMLTRLVLLLSDLLVLTSKVLIHQKRRQPEAHHEDGYKNAERSQFFDANQERFLGFGSVHPGTSQRSDLNLQRGTLADRRRWESLITRGRDRSSAKRQDLKICSSSQVLKPLCGRSPHGECP